MASTIECPHCKGRVHHRRGQSLPDALENHVRLSHTINGIKPTLKAPRSTKSTNPPPKLSKRPAKKLSKTPVKRSA